MDSSVVLYSVQRILDRSWLDDYGVKWIQYVAGLMGQLSIGLLVLVIIGRGLVDRRGDLKLFDRSTSEIVCTTLCRTKIVTTSANTFLTNVSLLDSRYLHKRL